MSNYFSPDLHNWQLGRIRDELKSLRQQDAPSPLMKKIFFDRKYKKKAGVESKCERAVIDEQHQLQVVECEKQTFIEQAININESKAPKALKEMWLDAEQTRINLKWKHWNRVIIEDDFAQKVKQALFGQGSEFKEKYKK